MPTPTPATIAEVLDRAAVYLDHPDVAAIPFAIPSARTALVCTQLAAEVLAAPPAPRYLAIYIGTTNDTNGNPRRGWYVHDLADPSAPVTWIEEGYRGTSAHMYEIAAHLGMPTATWRDVATVRELVRETDRIDVTPGEYRAARKLPRFGGAK